MRHLQLKQLKRCHCHTSSSRACLDVLPSENDLPLQRHDYMATYMAREHRFSVTNNKQDIIFNLFPISSVFYAHFYIDGVVFITKRKNVVLE